MPATPNTEGGAGSIDDRREFDALVDGGDAVLVHFQAGWSRVCRQVDTEVDELAEQYGVETARVDVEEHPLLAADFDVDSLPTVLVFADGEPVARCDGVRDRSRLAERVESTL